MQPFSASLARCVRWPMALFWSSFLVLSAPAGTVTNGYITALLRSQCSGAPPPPPLGVTKVGSDYIIMTVADANPRDFQQAQQLVSDADFEALMPLYCALPRTGIDCVTDTVFWNLETYDVNGNPVISGCPASGCEYYSCSAPEHGPPVIVGQPTNQAVFAGQQATFLVSTISASPWYYQWVFDGTIVLAGATNGLLVLANVQPNQAGTYQVEAYTSFGSTNSFAAALTVNPGPAIIGQPTNQSVNYSQSAIFGVDAFGAAPLYYQWVFDETNVLAGATNATLVLPSAQTNQAGTYQVEVYNAFGSSNSLPATLTVNPGPDILAQPTNQSVYAGQPATFIVNAASAAPLFYQWVFDGINVLAGATNDYLALANAQDNQAGSYQVEVYNASGSTNSLPATLTVNPGLIILVQPSNQSVNYGQSATFGVEAAGAEPLYYQWVFDETNGLAGATNSTLVLPNAQTNQAGIYQVEVYNALGSTNSRPATLTVYPGPVILVPPSNQSVYAGQPATFAVNAVGVAPLYYQWVFDETNVLAGATNSTVVLSNTQTNQAGAYQVQVNNAFGSTNSRPASLAVLTGPIILVQPSNESVNAGQAAMFGVDAAGALPLYYQWVFDGTNVLAGATNWTLVLPNAQTNQAGSYQIEVYNTFGSTNSLPATLTVNPGPAATNGLVGYQIVVPANSSVLVANQLNHGSNQLPDLFGSQLADYSMAFFWNCCDESPTNYGNGWGAIPAFFNCYSGYIYDPTTPDGLWCPDCPVWYEPDDATPANLTNITVLPGNGVLIYNLGGARILNISGSPNVPVLPAALPCGVGNFNLLGRQTNDLGTYENITGLAPQEGAQVLRWNPVLTNFTTYTFLCGAWTPSTPILDIGEAAFFRVPNDLVLPCPSNVVVASYSNLPVFYAPAATSSGCSNVAVVCTPPSGSLFAPGTTTTVKCVATDCNGNSAKCSFTVTVTGPVLTVTPMRTITWIGGGVLQQAAQLTGPWTDVVGGEVSPYDPPADAQTTFYRVRSN